MLFLHQTAGWNKDTYISRWLLASRESPFYMYRMFGLRGGIRVPLQDVFLMIRRDKMTIFLDATEETTVLQLKKMLEGIIKKSPEDHKLYNVDSKEVLEDSKSLGDCGYKSQGAKAQDPAAIGLAYRISETEFEEGVITPYSSPPELPEVMKPQEGSAAPSGLSAD